MMKIEHVATTSELLDWQSGTNFNTPFLHEYPSLKKVLGNHNSPKRHAHYPNFYEWHILTKTFLNTLGIIAAFI